MAAGGASSHYDVLRALGQGGYGKALLCQRRDTKEHVVIKVVDTADMDDTQKKYCVQEYLILRQFSGHPCIVGYKDCAIENDQLLLLMDYCEGGDLDREIQSARKYRRPIPEANILAWLTEILLGLKEIHQHKVLHRDIKPSNIMLDREGRAKIGDFGVSRQLAHTAAMANTCIGTPPYMAPELWANAPYSAACDIWALGITVFELAALEIPWSNVRSQQELIHSVTNKTIPMLPFTYSMDLQQVVTRMLMREPLKRPMCDELLQMKPIRETLCRLNFDLDPNSPKNKRNSLPRAQINPAYHKSDPNPQSVPHTQPF